MILVKIRIALPISFMSIDSSSVVCAESNESASYDPTSEEIERIIDGGVADIREYPHLVSLRDENNSHFCGASIISSKHCLTAAHCTANRTNLEILAGSTFLTGIGARHGIIIRVSRIIQHERYAGRVSDMDIAILVLAKELPVDGAKIRVAALPEPNRPLPFGKSGYVAGW